MNQSARSLSLVQGFFSEVQENLKLKFRGWESDLPHQGEKGGIRERRVKDFLRSILPAKYGLGSGHIIDSQGQISCQSDIVIYNAVEGIALPVDDYYSLFPCECVYAVVEVKSELNAADGNGGPTGTIYECLTSNTKLKSLYRDKPDIQPIGPIHFIVFGYTTAWKNNQACNLKTWFENIGSKYSMKLPEVIFVLDPSFALGTGGPSGYNEKGEMTHEYMRDPLLFLVSDLIYRLSQTKVTTPNLWDEYNIWLPGDVIVRINE